MPDMKETMPELFMTEAEIAEQDWEQSAEQWTPEPQEPS